MAVRARPYPDTTSSIFGSSKHRAKLPGVTHACTCIPIALLVLWPDISSHGPRKFELAWLPAHEGLSAWFADVHTYMCTRIHVVHDVLDASCHGGPSFIPLCIDDLHAKLQLALQPAACGHVHE
jgi:hypothetical protein